MGVEVPPLISVEDFLAGASPVPMPSLGWGEAKGVLAERFDAKTHLTVVEALAHNFMHACGTRDAQRHAIAGREVCEVLVDSPLARWGVMRLFDYEAAKFTPLDVYRFVAGADAPTGDDALAAMHSWATAVLCYQVISDPFVALDACRDYLDLAQDHGWGRADFQIAGIVLDAAVEGVTGPIGPIGAEVMKTWEERLAGAVEAVDPDYAYTENQLLYVWRH